MNLFNILKSINAQLWGPPMMILLGGFGIISTIYLGFPQIKKFKLGISHTFGDFLKKEDDESSISSFQSLATAVAAQVGTGNIAGVATAIVSGGPGAVFWMWATAVFGMSTILVEAILAQEYRVKKDGKLIGGPAFYLRRGLEERGYNKLGKLLAGFFAFILIIGLGFVGNMVQSNSITSVVGSAFSISPQILGVIIAIIAGLIIIGGIKRIAKFTELVVPVMAFAYIIGAILVLIKYRIYIPTVFKAIFIGAFSSKAIIGGVAGVSVKTAIRYGVARGLFSNEAGMGSTPNSHAVANVAHPVIQGSVAMVGVLISTGIVCTATALVVLLTKANTTGLQAAEVTQEAFRIAFGDPGAKFLALTLMFFGFTTIIGWYYFGETNIKYLFDSEVILKIYQVLVLIFIFLGSLIGADLVWEMADFFNGMMIIPNIIGLFILLKEAKVMYNDYDMKVKRGEPIDYNYKYVN